MDAKIEKELKLLKAYAVFSLFLFAGLIFLAFKGPARKVRFCEIDAERINILEKDDTLRLVISNNDRMHGGALSGVELKSREGKRGAGMIFFNDDGDECGGLVYTGRMTDGKPFTSGGFTFDHFRQNEAIAMGHNETNGVRQSGFQVYDQPTKPFSAEMLRGMEDIQTRMKDGPEKDAAMKKLREDHADEMGWTPRVFVGRSPEEGAVVLLMDEKARPRIRLAVDPSGSPVLQFLDENGKVVYGLPTAAPAGK